MEVILNQDYPSLGYVGDQVKVKPGYGRNFLIPRGIAVEASKHNSNLLKHRLSGIQAKKIKLRGEAQEIGAKMEALKLEFMVRVGSQGKAFGSVTAKDIEAALQKENFTIDRRQIRLTETIKKPGEYKIQVKLHSEVIVTLPIKVNSDLPEKKAVEGEEGAPKKKGRAKRAAGRSAKGKSAGGEKEEASQSENTEPETASSPEE